MDPFQPSAAASLQMALSTSRQRICDLAASIAEYSTSVEEHLANLTCPRRTTLNHFMEMCPEALSELSRARRVRSRVQEHQAALSKHIAALDVALVRSNSAVEQAGSSSRYVKALHAVNEVSIQHQLSTFDNEALVQLLQLIDSVKRYCSDDRRERQVIGDRSKDFDVMLSQKIAAWVSHVSHELIAESESSAPLTPLPDSEETSLDEQLQQAAHHMESKCQEVNNAQAFIDNLLQDIAVLEDALSAVKQSEQRAMDSLNAQFERNVKEMQDEHARELLTAQRVLVSMHEELQQRRDRFKHIQSVLDEEFMAHDAWRDVQLLRKRHLKLTQAQLQASRLERSTANLQPPLAMEVNDPIARVWLSSRPNDESTGRFPEVLVLQDLDTGAFVAVGNRRGGLSVLPVTSPSLNPDDGIRTQSQVELCVPSLNSKRKFLVTMSQRMQ